MLPGLGAALAVAAVARLGSAVVPRAVGEVLVAVLLGILTANLLGLPDRTAPGIRFAVHRLLRIGIVLLGARLSLADVATIGLDALGLVALCMVVAFAVALVGGRVLRLPPALALLIGVGTAVCGNSAIVATASVIEPDEREVGFAVATITLFGTLAVFVYPFMGQALGMSDAAFGLWTGLAVNDTSQVVAASAAYSPFARDVAVVVKLVRNTLMAPLLLLVAWWWSRRQASAGGQAVREGALRAFPLFVLGFLGMALARTLGLIGAETAAWLDEGAKVAILVALAGVGLSTRVAHMRAIGPTPFVLGLAAATLLAVLSLTLILALGLDPAPVPAAPGPS
jgi:uncharacterized integral membrane protein (TIGR00698 family)